jgi:hypothetical protein
VWAVEKFSKVGTEARPMGTEELKSLIAADVKIPDCAIEEAWQPDVRRTIYFHRRTTFRQGAYKEFLAERRKRIGLPGRIK